MTDSKTPPTFRRAAAPLGRAPSAASSTPVPGGTLRLNKRMAELGLASRREADDWIGRGWVKVNGEVATMGMQVLPDVRIEINKQAQGQQANQVTILLNKPMGIVSGQAEDGHLPAITLIQPQNRWVEDNARFFFHPKQLQSLVPAGRLDIDSIGLLVLTQDGRVARQLIGEESVMEKEYLVRVSYIGFAEPDGQPDRLLQINEGDPVTTNVQAMFPPAGLAKLRHGLSLDGQALKPAKVAWQNPEQLRIVLTEGKKRQIRRMCELVGLKVVGLKRVRIGNVMLGNLPVGQWRYLAPHERF
ncbi:MAG: rRNA pseudouridine synthase [Rhodoferax sp.]|uniref:pseudouridine synthase n=1 Tax=Rhodoferax sp. TaxID=50421 RepID=UPI00184E251B|nr:pseudouridine synthase [Rhodoferax sp.]NMM13813.1 rRNA pseudouridine synthase [Rhodoferax sp.]NMM20387.1 rRNA pseudouridine synthase [Rhodoferax sp.]